MRTKPILLIEDDIKDVEHIKKELSKLNAKYTLQVAKNGLEGLELLTSGEGKQLPDIILLNLNMPKMNGLEFLRIIKSYHKLKQIKVYVISASSEEYDRQLAIHSGADDYIIKPLSFLSAAESSEPVAKLRSDLEDQAFKSM